jgi:hypothetical protein
MNRLDFHNLMVSMGFVVAHTNRTEYMGDRIQAAYSKATPMVYINIREPATRTPTSDVRDFTIYVSDLGEMDSSKYDAIEGFTDIRTAEELRKAIADTIQVSLDKVEYEAARLKSLAEELKTRGSFTVNS